MNRLLFFVVLMVAVGIGAGAIGWRQARIDATAEHAGRAAAVGAPEAASMATPEAGDESTGLGAWAARLAAAAGADLAALADEAMALAVTDDRQRQLRLLAARWAEVDPVEGVAYFEAREAGASAAERNPWPRIWILTEWALRDVEAAWAHVSAGGSEAKPAGASDVGTELLRENLDVFWAWFQKAREPLPRAGDATSPAWRELARRHASALETLAAELAAAPGEERQRFSTPIFAGLYALIAEARAAQDPAAALIWARSVPEDARSACLRAVLPWLAKSDPDAARQALDDLKPKQVGDRNFIGSGREQVIDVIVSEMAKSDPRAAVEWASRAGGSGHDSIDPIVNVIKSALSDGRLTPQDAFALVREQESDGDSIRLNVLRKMWDTLPAATLAATAEWLQSVESDRSKDWALAGLVPAWARSDSDAATAFAQSLEDAGLRQSVLLEILDRRNFHHSSDAGLPETLASIPEADRADVIANYYRRHYGGGMLEHNISGVRNLDPTPFAEALVSTPPGESRDRSAKNVLGLWGAVDPDGAVAWAVQQPEPTLRSASLMGAIEGWANHDAWSVSQWLAEQPRGPDRDTATHQLARSLRNQEPDSAWIWASDIADAHTRLEARAAVLRQWRASDPTAARAAVSALPNLPPAEKQKLTDTLAGKD